MVGGVHAIYSAKGIRRRKEKRGTVIDSCVEWGQAKKKKKKGHALPLGRAIHSTLTEQVVGMQSPAEKYMRVIYLW